MKSYEEGRIDGIKEVLDKLQELNDDYKIQEDFDSVGVLSELLAWLEIEFIEQGAR